MNIILYNTNNNMEFTKFKKNWKFKINLKILLYFIFNIRY